MRKQWGRPCINPPGFEHDVATALHQSRGFTIVELLIAIAVLTLLLLMGIMNLQGAEKPARDEERKSDAGNIALGFERYFKEGNPAKNMLPGRYPSTGEVNDAISGGYIEDGLLPSTTKPMFHYSFKDDISTLKTAPAGKIDDVSGNILNAFNNTGSPISYIIYEPSYLDSTNSWALCTTAAQDCRRFNLYYYTEATASGVASVQTIRSVNQ